MTSERWLHISMGHPEIASFYFEIFETIEQPDCVYEGTDGELLAIRSFKDLHNKYIVAIYKEINNNDGSIITSYLSNKPNELLKRKVLWKPLQ